METNLFRGRYEKPEDRLSYNFLSLLEHLDISIATKILSVSGIPISTYERLQVQPLYGGREANPDGSIELEGPPQTLKVFFENKTHRRHLDLEQIKRHISVHLQHSGQRRLLVVTTDAGDRKILNSLNDARVDFMTWHDIADIAEQLSRTATESKDRLLLNEFQVYLETSGEAWRAKMLDSHLIDAHAQFLEISEAETSFLTKSRLLVETLRDEIASSFTGEIDATQTQAEKGRIGNYCELRKSPLRQWLFYGIYYDPKGHGIPFKERSQAEFAAFLDIFPENRERLQRAPGILTATADLTGKGFEFNFPDNRHGNLWRLCYWRESMKRYERASLDELRLMFETQLRTLFASDFYKIAADLT